MSGTSPDPKGSRRAAALVAAAMLLAGCMGGEEVPTLPRFEDAARPAEPGVYPTLGIVPPRPKDLAGPGLRAALQRQLEEEREAIRLGEPVPEWTWPTGKPPGTATVGRTVRVPDLALGLPDKPAAPADAAVAEKPPAPEPAAAEPAAAAAELLRRGRAAPPPRPSLAAP